MVQGWHKPRWGWKDLLHRQVRLIVVEWFLAFQHWLPHQRLPEVCVPARLKEPISPASPKVVEAECGRDWHRAGQGDVQKSKCLLSPKSHGVTLFCSMLISLPCWMLKNISFQWLMICSLYGPSFLNLTLSKISLKEIASLRWELQERQRCDGPTARQLLWDVATMVSSQLWWLPRRTVSSLEELVDLCGALKVSGAILATVDGRPVSSMRLQCCHG